MFLTAAVKAQIDALTYEQLLEGWRHTPVGDPMFQGESGTYWAQRMRQLREQLGNAQHVAASKRIGWTPRSKPATAGSGG